MFVFASDDGESWRYVTDLINEPISQAQYVRHRFVAKDLKTRGRHLAFYVAKGGFFAFVDEIEVIEGNHRADRVRSDQPAIATEKLEAEANRRAKRAVQKNITLAVIQQARSAVGSSSGGSETAGVARTRASATGSCSHHEAGRRGPLTWSALRLDRCRGLSRNRRILLERQPGEAVTILAIRGVVLVTHDQSVRSRLTKRRRRSYMPT